MRSSDSADRLALDLDLPTTTGDVVALRQIRTARQVPLEEYLEFLRRLGAPSEARLRSRRAPAGPPLDLTR